MFNKLNRKLQLLKYGGNNIRTVLEWLFSYNRFIEELDKHRISCYKKQWMVSSDDINIKQAQKLKYIQGFIVKRTRG